MWGQLSEFQLPNHFCDRILYEALTNIIPKSLSTSFSWSSSNLFHYILSPQKSLYLTSSHVSCILVTLILSQIISLLTLSSLHPFSFKKILGFVQLWKTVPVIQKITLQKTKNQKTCSNTKNFQMENGDRKRNFPKLN